MRVAPRIASLAAAVLLGACAAAPRGPGPGDGARAPERDPAPATPSGRAGAYYKDDGPGDAPPPNLTAVPDASPRREPLHRYANRPYRVFGREYVPLSELRPFRQRGLGSWYGRRFHGQRTSSGETYDMYAMTAAHPTLPIPSYARVTNTTNGRSVIVRINDRGPFHEGRIVDLSYTAALKLGYVDRGSAPVEVEAVLPGSEPVVAAAPDAGPASARALDVQPEPAPGAPVQDATVTPVAVAPSVRGLYLQLGAFTDRANAESILAKLERQVDWLRARLQLFVTGSLFKLQLGPFGSRDEARPVAERLKSELNFEPFFVVH